MEWRVMKGNPRYRVGEDGTIIDTKRNRELRPFFSQTTQKWMVDVITPSGGHNQMHIAKIILEAFAEKGEQVNSKRIIYIDGNINNYHRDNLTYKPHRTYEEALEYQREYARKKSEQQRQHREQHPTLTREDLRKIEAEKYKESIHQMYIDWTEALEQRLATEDLTPFQYWCVTSTLEANKKILQKYGQSTN